MKLEKVLEKVEYSIINGNTNTEITDICYDSRKIKEGCLFICLVGSSFDSHDYIDSAIEKGAKAILVEKNITREDITIIKVNNTRRVLSQISINTTRARGHKRRIFRISRKKAMYRRIDRNQRKNQHFLYDKKHS